jgi:ferredoxin-NADP reductase
LGAHDDQVRGGVAGDFADTQRGGSAPNCLYGVAELLRLEYFLCGPTPMLTAMERALAELGVPARRVHSELFEWV